MKYLRPYLLLAAILVFFSPVAVSAETVVRTGESVSVESNQVIENDFYAAGGTVTMSGDVTGDMYSAGGTVTVNGSIGQDLTLFAGSAQIHASTTDDVRVFGGEIVIAEHVGGDVFVMGGLLKILSTAEIDGDVIFYGGELEISGPVSGSVVGIAESVRIDSSIGGNVDFTSSRGVILGDRASVAGNVTYKSTTELTRAQNAVVEGDIIRTAPTNVAESLKFEDVLIPVFIILFATLCLYLVFRNELQSLVDEILATPSRAGLIGVGLFIGGPLVVIILMVTVLGILVGLLGLFAWLTMVLAAFMISSILAGAILSKLFTKRTEITLVWVVLGTLSVCLLSLIPVIGGFSIFVLFILSLGGLGYSGYRLFN